MSELRILTNHDARGVLTITLNRPEARNALDEGAISALREVCEQMPGRDDVRAVVLRGNGPVFSAGADINWMERLSGADDAANRADAEGFARMLSALDALPQPLIGRVHGAAIGGAIGLIAACDAVVASNETFFQFREARIGLAPATIAPLVARKIGAAQARYLFLSARRFDARRAEALGLIHEVVPTPDALDAATDRLLEDILAGGPRVMRAIKKMMRGLTHTATPMDFAGVLSDLRASEEAREGFQAFREKRAPAWKGNDPG